ncbi:MAG: hypothetical protein WD060_14805 [Pirellulales bacterium]
MRSNDTLIAETTPAGLLLRPAVKLPVEIYSDRRVKEFDESEAEPAGAMQASPTNRVKPAKRRR